MKSTKTLSLTNQLKLEATFYDTGTDLAFVVGKKEYKISDNEIKELVNWIGREVIGGNDLELSTSMFSPIQPISKAERTQLEKERAEKNNLISAAKPLQFDPQVAAKAFSKEHIFDGGQTEGVK